MFGMARGELIFGGIVVVLIFGWSFFPKFGERIGAMFERKRER